MGILWSTRKSETQRRDQALRASRPSKLGMSLLEECLTDAQRQMLARRGLIYVKGGVSGALYKVTESGGVYDYCVMPRTRWEEPLPPLDRMITMKLWIEGNEGGFLAHARPLRTPFSR